MAFFPEFPFREPPWSEEVATLHFSIDIGEDIEADVWDRLQEFQTELELEIRDAVSSTLGTPFVISRLYFRRGTIEVTLGIALAAAYAAYSAISRYKSFVDSLTLLASQVRRILRRFFTRPGAAPPAVSTTVVPSPAVLTPLSQWFPIRDFSACKPLLWYLMVSHAALVALFVWWVIFGSR